MRKEILKKSCYQEMPPTLIKRKQNLYTPFLTANKGIIQTSNNMSLLFLSIFR